MANANVHEALQNLGTGSTTALALTTFTNQVLAAFPTKIVASNYCQVLPLVSGTTVQVPATWKMSNNEHTKGTDIVGQDDPASEERLVTLDPKTRVSADYFSEYDQYVNHFNPNVAFEAAAELARWLDEVTIRCIINGANVAARTITVAPGTNVPTPGAVGDTVSFPSGVLLDNPRTGPIDTAYPITEAGSILLQADLAEMRQKFLERNVPEDGEWVAFMSPRMHRCLRQDKSLASFDYQTGTNDRLSAKLLMCEGFKIVPTNLMPTVNDTTASNSNYRGDFRYTRVACLVHPTGVSRIGYGGGQNAGVGVIGPKWIEEKLAMLLGAKLLQGTKWTRPEACGAITTTS